MEHCINDVSKVEELAVVIRVAEPKTNLPPFTHVETQQIKLVGIELCQCSYPPHSLSHDGLDYGGNFLEHEKSISFSKSMLLMRILRDEGIVFHFPGERTENGECEA